jgi:uncharacterized protein
LSEYDDLPLHLIGGDAPQEPVAVPHAELSPEALTAVIEAFVLREGTDYGEHEFTLERKIAQVRALLESGGAQIVFDPNSATVDIVRLS